MKAAFKLPSAALLCKDTAKIRDNKKIRHLFLYYPPFFLAKSKYSSYLCRKNLQKDG